MRFKFFVLICVSLIFISIAAEPPDTLSDENEQENEANFEIPPDQDTSDADDVIYEVPRVQVDDESSEEYSRKEDENSDHYTFVALIDIMFTDGCKRTCTGSIIHDNVVITTAHCFTMVQRKFLQPELSLSFVVIGTKRMFETGYEQYLPIEKVVTHPRFHGWTADLALVFTFANMYSDKPAEILPLALEKSSVPVDSNVTVLSWGKCRKDVESDAEKNRYNRNNKDKRQRTIYQRVGAYQMFSEEGHNGFGKPSMQKSIKAAQISSPPEHHVKASFVKPHIGNINVNDKINNNPRFQQHDRNKETERSNKNNDQWRQRPETTTPSPLPPRNNYQQQNYHSHVQLRKETERQAKNQVKKNDPLSLSEEVTKAESSIFEEYNYKDFAEPKWIDKKVVRKPVPMIESNLESEIRRRGIKEPSIQPFFDLQDYDGVSFVKPKSNLTNETKFIVEKIKKPVEIRKNLSKGKLKNDQQRKVVSTQKSRRNGAFEDRYIGIGAGKYTHINKTKGRRYIRRSNLVDMQKYKNWRREIGKQYNNLTVGKFGYVNVATCKKMIQQNLPSVYDLKNKHEYLCYSSEEFYMTNEDSGAPVVQNGELAAVTIGGVDNDGDHFAVGIKVACFCEWIAKNLPNNDGSMLKCCTNCCNNKSANVSKHRGELGPELRTHKKKKTRQGSPGGNVRFQKYQLNKKRHKTFLHK